MATIKETPNGCNKRPSIPLRKNKGIKAVIIMSVAIKIEFLISLDASKIIFKAACFSLAGFSHIFP